MSIQYPATIELSDLNGKNGFKLNGIVAGDRSGYADSGIGDINADGIDDLIVSAYLASPNGVRSGQSYVVFGGSSVGSMGTIELSNVNGGNGFKINGITSDNYSGVAVNSAGDVNADGVLDLLVGASKADVNGVNSGQSYIIFGGAGVGSTGTIQLSNLNGANGFSLNGVAAGDRSGVSVSQAGDINNDGIGDLVIGSDRADPNGSDSGQSYVIWGGGV